MRPETGRSRGAARAYAYVQSQDPMRMPVSQADRQASGGSPAFSAKNRADMVTRRPDWGRLRLADQPAMFAAATKMPKKNRVIPCTCRAAGAGFEDSSRRVLTARGGGGKHILVGGPHGAAALDGQLLFSHNCGFLRGHPGGKLVVSRAS